jgi:hypothetical protein
MTMGLVIEASIPKHLRWLPKGMDINYLKKASKKLIATSTIDPQKFFDITQFPGEAKVPIEVRDMDGNLVVTAEVIEIFLDTFSE